MTPINIWPILSDWKFSIYAIPTLLWSLRTAPWALTPLLGLKNQLFHMDCAPWNDFCARNDFLASVLFWWIRWIFSNLPQFLNSNKYSTHCLLWHQKFDSSFYFLFGNWSLPLAMNISVNSSSISRINNSFGILKSVPELLIWWRID